MKSVKHKFTNNNNWFFFPTGQRMSGVVFYQIKQKISRDLLFNMTGSRAILYNRLKYIARHQWLNKVDVK